MNLALARELRQRMPGLIPVVEKALFVHYEPYREAADAGEYSARPDPFPDLASPNDVWKYVTPRRVTIGPLAGVPTVEIAYETAWDIEHTVGARFQNWTWLELCGSV